MNYDEFLEKKKIVFQPSGFKVNDGDINQVLHPFQRDLVRYQIAKGRSACFAETGLGKSAINYEVTRIQQEEVGKPALIFAPLSVAWQMIDDIQELLGGEINYIKSSDDPLARINVTNYERIHKMDMSKFGPVSLDESSILKAFNSKTRQLLTDSCVINPYRNCYTATPSPNDIVEIGNHSWFLGIMSEAEMKATFFMNRANKQTGEKWQIKGWAEENFYKWLASWGLAVRKPSDLGYSDDGYILPKLNITPHYIDTGYKQEGMLFNVDLKGLSERNEVRRETVGERCDYAADIVNRSNEQFIVWCYLNDEADLMNKLISDSVNVQGSDSPEYKAKMFQDFKKGKFRVLVTKPKIAGFGMNFQHSSSMVFVGIDDSMETVYQCVRRQWRFKQENQVNVHIVLAKAQKVIYQNIKRKEKIMKVMQQRLVENSKQYAIQEIKQIGSEGHTEYNPGIPFQLPTFMRGI